MNPSQTMDNSTLATLTQALKTGTEKQLKKGNKKQKKKKQKKQKIARKISRK